MKHERAIRYERALRRIQGIIEVAEQLDVRTDGSILLTRQDVQRIKTTLENVDEPGADTDPS